MRRYELTFIVDPDISEDKRVAILEKTKSLIETEKGIIVNVDEWGQKKLAYEIKKKTRGYYICMNFCGTPALVDEIERTFRLDDKVMKFLTLILSKEVDTDSIQDEIKNFEQKNAQTKEAAAEETSENSEDSADDNATESSETEEEEEA